MSLVVVIFIPGLIYIIVFTDWFVRWPPGLKVATGGRQSCANVSPPSSASQPKPVGAVGVALYSMRALMGLSCDRMCSAMLTDFSAAPSDWGYLGLDVVAMKPHSSAKALNSLRNWGPLSVMTYWGMPQRAKTFLNLVMVVLAMVSWPM